MFDKKDLEHINNLTTNFRSDVIAAAVVDNGLDADKVVILRRQGEARMTDKEIINIEYKQDYENHSQDVLQIRTNRQGIYDHLPEGVFHDCHGLKDNSPELIIHTIRHQHKQEFFIRRFFSLFEAETERARIDIQLTEFRYDRPDKHRTFVDTMSPLWPVIRQMDSRTAMLFISMVPYIDEIRTSYPLIAQALSVITGHRVRIEKQSAMRASGLTFPRLGSIRLGVNAILKGDVRHTCAKVMATPCRENLKELLPGRKHYTILVALLRIFMPCPTDYELHIVPAAEDYTARPVDKNCPCILGVNARLVTKPDRHYAQRAEDIKFNNKNT